MKKYILSLLALFFVAIFLRFAFLPDNLFFGPEQGRDFLVIKDIVVSHNITLIGPKTDIAGIFHGPLFYYLSAIPFALSNGDPLVISFFLILVNSSTVFFLYLLGARLHSKRVGMIAAILFAVSFYAIVNARWLSNPPLSIPFAALSLYFLIDFLKGKKRSLLGYAIGIGLLNQVEFLNILFSTIFTLGIGILFFDKFKKAGFFFSLANFLLMMIISLGVFILFDFRHDFLITKNIIALFIGETGFSLPFITVVQSAIHTFFTVFSLTIAPNITPLGVGIFFAATMLLFRYARKQKIYRVLLLWVFIPLIALIFLRHDVLEHFFVSLIPVFILLTAFLVDKLWQRSIFLGGGVLLLFICIQLFMWGKALPQNKAIFFQSTQLELRYHDQLLTIDRIYKETGNTPFAIQAYTIPYWSSQAWEYLFWRQRKQPVPEKEAGKLFVIIQDDPSNKRYQEEWLKNTVSKWGKRKEEFRYGVLTTREIKLGNEK